MGSCIRGRLLFVLGLPIVLAGSFVAARAAWRVDACDSVSEDTPRHTLVWGLAAMALVGLLAPSTVGPPSYDWLKRGYFVAGLFAVVIWRFGQPSLRRGVVALMMTACCAIHVAGPILVSDPFIDSWAWVQSGVEALIAGQHPYRLETRDIIHGEFYEGRSAAIYPYMPLTLLATVPAQIVFGDTRALGVLSIPASLALVGALGRRLRLSRDLVDVTRLILILHPRGFWLTCSGWLEPVMAFLLVAFAYFTARHPGGLTQATTFLLVPAWKQYFLVPPVLFLWERHRSSRRTLVAALALPVATLVPLMLWDWRTTVQGVLLQLSEPHLPRLDSTSLVALGATATGWYPGRWLSLVAQMVVGTIAYRRLRHTGPPGLLLASGLAMLATFLVGWQAFVNYYLVAAVLLSLAALFLAATVPPARQVARAAR